MPTENNSVSLTEVLARAAVFAVTGGYVLFYHINKFKAKGATGFPLEPLFFASLALQAIVGGFVVWIALLNYHAFWVGRIKKVPLSKDPDLRSDEVYAMLFSSSAEAARVRARRALPPERTLELLKAHIFAAAARARGQRTLELVVKYRCA